MAVNDLQLVEHSIEHGKLSKLLRLPTSLDDFSEASLIRSVEFFIKASDSEIESATQHVKKKTMKNSFYWKEDVEPPFPEQKCYALNTMLKQRYSTQFLQEAARCLSFDCALSLIKYLNFLLVHFPTLQDSNTTMPSLEQIIDWLNAALDSHVQQLKLAEDAAEVIQSLEDQVNMMTKCQIETKTLQGVLAELNKQVKKQQMNTKVGNYCIEVITF